MRKAFFLIFNIIGLSLIAQENCDNNSFLPSQGEQYVLSAWVKDDVTTQEISYKGYVKIEQDVNGLTDAYTYIFRASGPIIDGWQRIEGQFTVPNGVDNLEVKLISLPGGSSYFDDIRVFPVNGNMKSFVYDPITQRLMAELDENNYATFYEYDKEGGLVRVKKETQRGVYTIQETRSGNSTLNSN